MKIAANIAGALLGLAFLMASLTFFLHMMPEQKPPAEGSYMALFMGAFAPSGYLAFVKSCELIGAILVMIPKTRNFGLLFLGPVILNILAFHIFIAGGTGLFDPMLIGICVLAAFLLWVGREKFLALKN